MFVNIDSCSPFDGLSAGPGGPSASLGQGSALPGGGETPGAFLAPGAIRGAADPFDDPSSDSALGSFFLGSLGSNVSSESTVDALVASHPCGEGGGWFVSREKGRQWPARCKKLTCVYCLPREASIRQLIIAESEPDTSWSQTMVADASDPDPWPTVRKRVNLALGYYRRWGGPARSVCYTVEMNPEKTGYHMHAVCWGPHFKMPLLLKAIAAAGLGEHGNKVKDIDWSSRDAAGYGLKGFSAAGYGLKGFDGSIGKESLRINGGRMTHQTRGFWRVNGKSVKLAAARRSVMLKKYGAFTGDAMWMASPVGAWWFDTSPTTDKTPSQKLIDDL